MARKQTFLAAVWSDGWKEGYAKLSAQRQAACDEAAMALIKQVSSPGLRIKPIQPAKYYLEARINSGDRIIFRLAEGTISSSTWSRTTTSRATENAREHSFSGQGAVGDGYRKSSSGATVGLRSREI